jgi:ribonuclease VapC
VIVLETSAIVAIAKNELDASRYIDVMRSHSGHFCMPATCYLEATMVFKGSPMTPGWLDDFLVLNNITLHPVSGTTAHLAANAFERYGRGSGHPARLNFGDCVSYAVAKELDAPLLFKGRDFAHTDVKRVL